MLTKKESFENQSTLSHIQNTILHVYQFKHILKGITIESLNYKVIRIVYIVLHLNKQLTKIKLNQHLWACYTYRHATRHPLQMETPSNLTPSFTPPLSFHIRF